MKTKRYRLLQLPFMSFFSKRLYQDIGRNWKGGNLAYLFLLLAICCVPVTLHQRDKILQSLETGQTEILNQIPAIQITDGNAIVDAPMPHTIRNRAGNPVAIIDTTGSMNYIDDDTVMIMLTETKLIVRRGRNLFNTFSLEGIEEFHMDKFAISAWLSTIQKSVAPISYGIFLMLSYIFAVLTLILVSVVGLILSSLMHNELSFKDTLRIATTAATPAIITITVAAASGLSIPAYIYFGITILYLFIGIKSCSGQPDGTHDEERVDLKSLLNKEISKTLDEAA